jgi:hypothetical protein
VSKLPQIPATSNQAIQTLELYSNCNLDIGDILGGNYRYAVRFKRRYKFTYDDTLSLHREMKITSVVIAIITTTNAVWGATIKSHARHVHGGNHTSRAHAGIIITA